MSLSSRALTYLATLKRGEQVPIERVAEALEISGCPTFAKWIDFHSRFAGYEEEIGRDTAIWGILHSAPTWIQAGAAEVERDGDLWRVTCADVHPSYGYWLDSDGRFGGSGSGGPFQTFDVKVERNAVFWEAIKGGRSWVMDFNLGKVLGADVESWRRWIPGIELVPEASDMFSRCWKSSDLIAVQRNQGLEIYAAADAHERIAKLVCGGGAGPM
jgi:hypothetical protein